MVRYSENGISQSSSSVICILHRRCEIKVDPESQSSYVTFVLWCFRSKMDKNHVLLRRHVFRPKTVNDIPMVRKQQHTHLQTLKTVHNSTSGVGTSTTATITIRTKVFLSNKYYTTHIHAQRKETHANTIRTNNNNSDFILNMHHVR